MFMLWPSGESKAKPVKITVKMLMVLRKLDVGNLKRNVIFEQG